MPDIFFKKKKKKGKRINICSFLVEHPLQAKSSGANYLQASTLGSQLPQLQPVVGWIRTKTWHRKQPKAEAGTISAASFPYLVTLGLATFCHLLWQIQTPQLSRTDGRTSKHRNCSWSLLIMWPESLWGTRPVICTTSGSSPRVVFKAEQDFQLNELYILQTQASVCLL